MAQDGDAACAIDIFFRTEGAAKHGDDSKDAEEISGDAEAGDLNCVRIAREIRGQGVHGRQSFEGAIAPAPIEEVLRLGGDVSLSGGLNFPDHDEAAGVGERQRLEQHGIDHAEDGGGGSNAEREGGQSERGERKILDEHAGGKAQVLRGSFDDGKTPHISCDLFR
jgi:hypothetical protein